jgi:hypothetical protein
MVMDPRAATCEMIIFTAQWDEENMPDVSNVTGKTDFAFLSVLMLQ